MTGINIAHAKLIPMNGAQVESDQSKHIEVQFNPASLKVTLANSLKADNGGGFGEHRLAAQFIGKSESNLFVELLFDTSVSWQGVAANSDVRKLTKRIAESFMQPQEFDPRGPRAPKRCRFQWGSFQFTGMLANYSETLDFFAPEGIPLRATLALTFKEDRYQFERDEGALAAARTLPVFAPGGAGVSADRAAQAAGQDPSAWRQVADANNLENPRSTPAGGVNVPLTAAASGGRA